MRRLIFVLFIINYICCLSKTSIDSVFYRNTIRGITKDYRTKNYDSAIKKCNILIKKGENELEHNNDYLIYGYHARGILNYYNSDTSSGRKDIEKFITIFLSKNNINLDDLISYSNSVVEVLTNLYPDTTLLTNYYERIISRLGKTNDISSDIYHNFIDEYIYLNRNFVNKYEFLSKQFELLGKNKNDQTKILNHYIILYDALTSHDNFSDTIFRSLPPNKLMDIYLDFSSKGVSICEKYKTNDTLSAFFNNLYGFMLFSDNKLVIAKDYIKKSVDIYYSIKYYPERFIESINNLIDIYNLDGNYELTISTLDKFDKLRLSVPQKYADEICTNRIYAIYGISKNKRALNQIVDSIEVKYNCKFSNKYAIGNEQNRVSTFKSHDNPSNIDKINVDNISEYIETSYRLHTQGDTELTKKYYKIIGETIDKILNNNSISKNSIYFLSLTISYISKVFDYSKEGQKRKDLYIQKVVEILNYNSINIPDVTKTICYMLLMNYYLENNDTYNALKYGSLASFIFKDNNNKLIQSYYPLFLYSYYDLIKGENKFSFLEKAIKIEEETKIDVVSYQSYIKIFQELYLNKNKTKFEEYAIRFIPYLEQFINLNYLFYDKDRQTTKLSNYLIDIDMLIDFGQKLKCSISCLNTLYATLFSLRDLEINTYKYLKNVNPKNLEEIRRFNLFRDSIYQVSTNLSIVPDNDLDSLLKLLNLEARKLMLDSKLKLVQFEKYNPDSIRAKLKPNECFLFNFRDAYFGDSSRQLVLKYDTLKFGIGFDKSIDNKSLIVRNVLRYSPSIKYIKPNDKIIQVNNVKYDSDELAQEIFNSKKIELKYLRGADTLSNTIFRDSVFYEYYSDYENWIIIDSDHSKPNNLRIYIDDYSKLYKNYYSSLSSNYDANTFKVTLNDLYPLLKNYSNIYYSLAGKYSELNIEWLQNPADSSYLGIKHNFYNCSSVSDFYSIKNPSTSQVNKSMIVFSNPTLSNDNLFASNIKKNRSASEDIESYYKLHNKPIFVNLPSTAEESNKITKIGIDANISVKNYTKNDCSESNIKLTHSPSILHIATHGYVLNKNDSITIFQSKSGTSNLFNTALILSEYDKNLKEDGILTAYEIMQLDLKNTELVVLSACETANGQAEINGNSSNSLQKAFRLAGARAVLASKWKVPDQQTQELMVEFYTNWLEMKMTKHKALQQAQLTLSKKYPEPYYWAAWVLYGE